jgi:hypothetical protein
LNITALHGTKDLKAACREWERPCDEPLLWIPQSATGAARALAPLPDDASGLDAQSITSAPQSKPILTLQEAREIALQALHDAEHAREEFATQEALRGLTA